MRIYAFKKNICRWIVITIIGMFAFCFMLYHKWLKADVSNAIELYKEFLDGEISVRDENEEVNIDFITIPTGEPGKHYFAEYTYFDINRDKIPELHVKSARYYYILSVKNNKLYIWKNMDTYYNLLNNGDFLRYREGAAPISDSYIYTRFFNEVQCEFSFYRCDLNENNVYDDEDEYGFAEINVSKKQWDFLTKKYINLDGNLKDEIQNRVNWINIYPSTT